MYCIQYACNRCKVSSNVGEIIGDKALGHSTWPYTCEIILILKTYISLCYVACQSSVCLHIWLYCEIKIKNNMFCMITQVSVLEMTGNVYNLKMGKYVLKTGYIDEHRVMTGVSRSTPKRRFLICILKWSLVMCYWFKLCV